MKPVRRRMNERISPSDLDVDPRTRNPDSILLAANGYQKAVELNPNNGMHYIDLAIIQTMLQCCLIYIVLVLTHTNRFCINLH